MKAASWTPEGALSAVEFFSPVEVIDAEGKRAAQLLMKRAEEAEVMMDDMEPTPEMRVLMKRIADTKDPEEKEAYRMLLDQAKRANIAYHSS